ncbi:hypothetical protein BDN70DRAFT_767364, partial [Pholiota conissans]
LKDKGVVSDSCRAMIRDLGAMNIPEEKTCNVIKTVAKGLGLQVVDTVSARTVGRIMKEGGLASTIQLVSEIDNGKGLTLSSDGTTIRHRNYESRHINMKVPLYNGENAPENKFTTRFLGIGTAPNHTSNMQLHGLQKQVEMIYNVYNKSPLGENAPADAIAFPTYMLGLGSDHAEDQKRLSKLLLEWKIISTKQINGRRYMETTPLNDLLPIILDASTEKIEKVGGVSKWDALSEAEKDRLDGEAYKQLCLQFGEESWNKLSEEDRQQAQLFVWCGCSMHKEMNSVKGGAKAMARYWQDLNIQGPVKLMNRDNAAAVAMGSSLAADRANEVSEGGAVKLTSLAGAIFNHKDQKKGQQDTYRIFFEDRLGYRVDFPNTSSIRFQCHCIAASALLIHLPLYLEFLLLVRDKKENRNFNHMEHNVYVGLQDIPTLTELCVLSLYSQAISNPYMRKVRGSGDRRMNALDAGPLHHQLTTHISKLIDSPDLLLSSDASYITGSLDGQIWEQPEVFYAVQRMKDLLPHLAGCLVAFLKGALETWYRFMSEFADDGVIAALSRSEKDRLWIDTTNDVNEGALGTTRQMIHRAPNISLPKLNARMTYRKNDTRSFIEHSFNKPHQQAFLRAETRREDSAGIPMMGRKEEIAHDDAEVSRKRERDAARRANSDARIAILDTLQLELDIETLRHEIRTQIAWHRRHDNSIPPKKMLSKMKKDDLLQELIRIIRRLPA